MSAMQAFNSHQNLKIAIVTSFPRDPKSPHGGVEAVSVNLVRALAKRPDMEIHVVTTDRNCPAEEINQWVGATIHRLPARSGKLLAYAVGEGRRQVQAYLHKLKPHVVHAHDTYGLMVKGLNIPRVFTIHGFIHEDTLYAGERFSRLRSLLWRRIETAGWADQPHIIAISPYVRERLRGIAKTTIHDIENPIAEEFFQINRNATRGTVFTAGLICERKNTLALLEAVRRLKVSGVPVQLNIAGKASDSEYAAKVKNFININDLSANVKLLGPIRNAEVQEQLATASVFVLLSFEEGAPMGIAEAMAAGVPIVTSNRCGMPYMIRQHESGFLVDPMDATAAAQKLGLLVSDRNLALQMGACAQKTAWERFHPDKVAQRTARVYCDILGLQRPPD